MKKEIFAVLATSLLLVTIFSAMSVSATMGQLQTATKIDFTIISGDDDGDGNGEVDFAIDELLAWWSPAPWFEDHEYLCHDLQIINVGAPCYEWGKLSIYYYAIEPNGHENEMFGGKEGKNWPKGFITREVSLWKFNTIKKPVQLRVEITTDLPESNLENNVKTVDVGYGVTIDGRVYSQDSNGENHPADGLVFCNSDTSLLSLYLSSTHPHPDYKGYYQICAPKKPGAAPFRYSLIAQITTEDGIKTQMKKTEPLDDFDYTQVDFIFKTKESTNSESLPSLIQRTTGDSIPEPNSSPPKTILTRLFVPRT